VTRIPEGSLAGLDGRVQARFRSRSVLVGSGVLSLARLSFPSLLQNPSQVRNNLQMLLHLSNLHSLGVGNGHLAKALHQLVVVVRLLHVCGSSSSLGDTNRHLSNVLKSRRELRHGGS
jgi:hypothetical protein